METMFYIFYKARNGKRFKRVGGPHATLNGAKYNLANGLEMYGKYEIRRFQMGSYTAKVVYAESKRAPYVFTGEISRLQKEYAEVATRFSRLRAAASNKDAKQYELGRMMAQAGYEALRTLLEG